MPLCVMLRAQPSHVQWLAVIVVVAMHPAPGSTFLAWQLYKMSVPNGVVDGMLCFSLAGVSLNPVTIGPRHGTPPIVCLLVGRTQRDAVRQHGSVSFILVIAVYVSGVVFTSISPCAILAFPQVTIGHLGVYVKLRHAESTFALEAVFHDRQKGIESESPSAPPLLAAVPPRMTS